VPELWVPGAAGPLDQFVERLHRRIEEFGRDHGLSEVSVEVEFADGALYSVRSIDAEPGFGFVTVRPHGDEPQELIVPIGSIKQIRLAAPEPARQRFGFSLPSV
jgi:hypothetical protein